MLLFLVLITASAVGTLLESRFDARVARFYLYEAWWFTVWLFVLCVNLAAAALSRWPWKARHTGFVTVHSGIILVLAGAMVGARWGIEGTVTLRVGEPPRARLVVAETALSFTDPADGAQYRARFPVDLAPPRPEMGGVLGAVRNTLVGLRADGRAERAFPSGAGRLVFDRYAESVIEERRVVPAEAGGAGVNLKLASAMMGRQVPVSLQAGGAEGADRFALFGLADLRLVTEIERPGPASGPVRPLLQVRVAGPGRVEFLAVNSRGAVQEGVLEAGGVAATGWADWLVTVEGAFPAARAEVRLAEAPAGLAFPGEESVPGVRGWMELADGTRTEPQWFVAGRTTRLEVGGAGADVAFGFRVEPLPMTVELERFEVPRDEGTQNPSAFTSHLVFRDLATGQTARDWCGMNRPAIFPGGWHRHLTGMTYKFSQASWNPDDLAMSTVQVLHDPGWLLKWIGSLTITAGLFIIFFGRRWRNRRPEDAVGPAGGAA